MPELPEVETVVRTVAPHLTGRRILSAEFTSRLVTPGNHAALARRLAGRRIDSVRRRGKFILIALDQGTLSIHLGMTGRLLVSGKPAGHTHAVFTLDDGLLLYNDPRQFGKIEWNPQRVERLGPEPLEISLEDFRARLQKFNINFVVNIQRKVPEGIEQFGFGLKSNHPKAEQHVLNELPLLLKFIDFFYEENKKLIRLSFDHQVEISALLGPCFYQRSNSNSILKEKNLLLKQLGLGKVLSLTSRELEVLKYLAHGYPATYIGKELHLSTRTVEHHIEAIKDKLNCKSKVALIKAAHEITSIIF